MENLFQNNKDNISKAIFAFVIIVSIFFVAKVINEFKSSSYIGREGNMQSTIYAEGKGEVFAMPDIATFSFTVSKKSKTVKEAQETVTDKMNKILDNIKESGIEDKDITTSGYNINPEYEYQQITCFAYPCPEGKRILTGYVVSHSIVLKVRELEKVGTLLNSLGELGATDVSGVTFSIDKQDELKKEARNKAIEQAKIKAKELAKELGVKLVRVISYNDYSNEPVYRGYEMMSSKVDGYGMGGGMPAPQIPTGENKIVSTVNIVYEIR